MSCHGSHVCHLHHTDDVYYYCSTHVGVTSALGQLLVLDMKMRIGPEKTYKCPFNLQSPQHPLLTVLKQSKDAWHDVINQIEFLCHHPEQM